MNTDKPDAVKLPGELWNEMYVKAWKFYCIENGEPESEDGRERYIDRVADLTSFGLQLTAENDRLKKEVEAAKEQLREFAEDVAYQYAYERAGCLTTGGLSTMETTFNILGWDDPHKLDGDSK